MEMTHEQEADRWGYTLIDTKEDGTEWWQSPYGDCYIYDPQDKRWYAA